MSVNDVVNDESRRCLTRSNHSLGMVCTISPNLVCLGYESDPQSYRRQCESSRHWRRMFHAVPESFNGRQCDPVPQGKGDPHSASSVRCLMNWSRMSFKPKKSRSLSIRKGKLDEDDSFKVASQDLSRSVKSPSRALEDGMSHP
ncbi:hypothetical protein PoB_005853200 [Plakobranchus ocellatus]|uniref:Uncharacterized protein n=1 Tax=Plakobranchus ocellatus TaxID=259542 RepID=A0AAV4CKS4_9GAST|nr:hypothetical protein PoB_005853200 [Plakobranchus ocellatus]